MYNYRKITEDVYYIGASDRRISIFEGVYPVPYGMSYNSYFVDGDETLVLDTVDKAVSGVFFENIEKLLGGRALNYLIVSHMEPDHSASLGLLTEKYPDVKIICSAKAKALIEQFCNNINLDNIKTVAEGEELTIGSHTYSFVMAPMVHWPEVMLSYDKTAKILYTADAFGTFGALSGNIFDDEVDFIKNEVTEARRYYTNIVGKYGVQVSALLKKAENLDVKMMCPLHGPIFRSQLAEIIELYDKWSTYTPEQNGVLIAYASIYGNTANAADILATLLAEKGIKTATYDISVTHFSEIISEGFKYSHIVLAAPTYNGSIFTNMETLLSEIKAHNLGNRTYALIENGSWGPMSGKIMKEAITTLKNANIIEPQVTLKSSVKANTLDELNALADAIAQTF